MGNSWNAPLRHRWVYHFPELVSAIKNAIRSSFPNGTGALAKSYSLGSIHKSGSNSIRITNSLPYAHIQNYGGYIPDRYPVNAQALHWTSGGSDVFAKHAKGFHITGKEYIEEAIEVWSKNDGLMIEWQ